MSEIAALLRLLVQADKEYKITAVQISSHDTPYLFSSNLTSGYLRKGIAVYNNSNTNSGEAAWGGVNVTPANGMPIPKGAIVAIPVSSALDVYFVNTVSGELSDLRVIEIA